MCTIVLLRRPGHPWPLLLAANRDERLDRPWDSPGPYWPDRPGMVAGRDRLGGGTWMGVRSGVMAAVLNRRGSLGPLQGKRSRGELPLVALAEADAEGAVARLLALDAGDYRPFNMVVADADRAVFVRSTGIGTVQAQPLGPGCHMVTAGEPDDPASPRIARHLPRFEAAVAPDPDGSWVEWQALLADRTGPPAAAINVPPTDGFGTVCSALLAIPAAGQPRLLFAPGPPDRAAYRPVPLD